jgi:hypothetical protein
MIEEDAREIFNNNQYLKKIVVEAISIRPMKTRNIIAYISRRKFHIDLNERERESLARRIYFLLQELEASGMAVSEDGRYRLCEFSRKI